MNTVLIICGILIALVLAFYFSLWAALRGAISPRRHLRVELLPPTPSGLELKLAAARLPTIRIEGISIPREMAAATGASPPEDFEPDEPEPLPEFEDFEADLDELAQEYAPQEPPEELIEAETRRQYEENCNLLLSRQRDYVSWTGSLRVRRGRPVVLLLPMTDPGKAGGRITLNYSYRVGLMTGSGAVFVDC